MKDLKHIPALDGLRGAAAFCVLFKHAYDLGIFAVTGSFGVTVFFALSGFLMAYLYARRPFRAETVFPYGVSRFARIAPIYLTVILASWIIRTHIDGDFIYDINNHNLLRHLLFSGSFDVFWSIPPEVQFYVFFLVLWWAIDRAGSGTYWPAILASGLVILMFAASPYAPGTTLPSKLPFFLFGAVAGYVSPWLQKQRIPDVVTAFAQIILIFLSFVYATSLSGTQHDFEAVYGSPVYWLLSALMVLSFSIPSRFASVVFANSAMRTLGAWSFGIYLLHRPSLYWGDRIQSAMGWPPVCGFLIGVGMTLALAALAHFIIEKPAQRHLKAWGGHFFKTLKNRKSAAASV